MKKLICVALALIVFAGLSKRSCAGSNEDLIKACREGNVSSAQAAIAAGANVNLELPDGNTPLSSAIFWPDVIRLLLDKGADPNKGTIPPLVLAANNYSTEAMKMLLAAKADPKRAWVQDNSKPIRDNLEKEKAKGKDANKYMIKAFEDMLAKGSFSASKQTAARIVVSTNNCAECLEILASSGADMKELNDNSENLLHTYALLGNTPEIKADLFRKGSATWEQSGYKLPDWYKNMDMSRNASVDKMVKTLTGFGIGINEQNKDGRSPLILNLGFDGIGGANEVAISLIKNGADVKAADEKWGSAIALASKRGNVDILRAMIDAGADINTESKEYDRNSMQFVKGFTPLTIAAMRNHTEAVKFLIEKGADVNEGVEGTSTNIKSNCITTIKGKTALFYAVENNNMDLVKSLVENPSLKWKNELRIDKWKQTSTFTAENAFLKTTTTTIRCIDDGTFTASRYAKELGFKELASYLKEKGL